MTHPVNRTIAAARRDLALSLEISDTAARIEMMKNEVIATGGTWIDPSKAGGWGPHFYEISLYGVSQTGDSAEEAVRYWSRAVLKMEDALADERGAAA